MSTWLFKRGEWSEIEWPIPETESGRDNDEDLLRAGYGPSEEFGFPEAVGAELFAACGSPAPPYPYLVRVWVAATGEHIFVPDLPSLLELLSTRVMPVVTGYLAHQDSKTMGDMEEAEREGERERRRRGWA